MNPGRKLIIEKEQDTIDSANKILDALEVYDSQNRETDMLIFTINNEISKILASSEMMLKILEYSDKDKDEDDGYVYKGTVKNRQELIAIDPLTLFPGDVYLNLENNVPYTWSGFGWILPKKNE